jgi:LysM repeat protein
MNECSACGAALAPHETRCPVCDKPTAHYHRQRYCLHCGAPAAEKAKTCMMCGQPVDSLPLNKSIFSGSWIGVGLGTLIIVGLVLLFYDYQTPSEATAQVAGPPSTATSTPTITATPTHTGTPLPTATHTPTPTATPLTHIIESGETLYYLADLYGVSIHEIMTLNSISEDDTLSVGQALRIPPRISTSSQVRPSPLEIIYTVESGDTLLGIALDHGTTVDGITAANPDLNLDLIFPGQQIVVPLATPTPTPTPTSTLTPTPTPGPLYPPPNLLIPADGQVVSGSTLFFNWTATALLAEDEFYVLQLLWPNGAYTEHWTKTSSWQISKDERLTNGFIVWKVAIMRQTGVDAAHNPHGIMITDPTTERTVEWP